MRITCFCEPDLIDVMFVDKSGVVVKAWDLAVATMKVGEKSRFYCKDVYVYTDETAQSADSHQQNHIVYDIELHSWQGFLRVYVYI